MWNAFRSDFQEFVSTVTEESSNVLSKIDAGMSDEGGKEPFGKVFEVELSMSQEGCFKLTGGGRSFSVPQDASNWFYLLAGLIAKGDSSLIIPWNELCGASTADASLRNTLYALRQGIEKDLGASPDGNLWLNTVKGIGVQLNQSLRWKVTKD